MRDDRTFFATRLRLLESLTLETAKQPPRLKADNDHTVLNPQHKVGHRRTETAGTQNLALLTQKASHRSAPASQGLRLLLLCILCEPSRLYCVLPQLSVLPPVCTAQPYDGCI